MHKTLLLALLLIALASLAIAAPTDDFAQGNRYFQDKDYLKAIEAGCDIVSVSRSEVRR